MSDKEKTATPEDAAVSPDHHHHEVSQSAASEEKHEDTTVIPMHDQPVKYDPDALHDFIDKVFHVERPPGVEVFVQVSASAPKGFGTTPGKLFKRLSRTEAPMRGYFSTATLYRHEDGTMRHTKQLFHSYVGVLLDDVKDKIPIERIPEELAPNYIIESSAGSEQWMFILKVPITDYDEAQALINLFVDAGLTDPGGAMPVKKVRLPCGVNGKLSEDKQHYPVTLKEGVYTDYWDVQELLDAAGIDVDWETYRKQCKTQKHKARRLGASAWNPDLHYVNSRNGVYDPVLEWMYEQGRVIQEDTEKFFDVICPFHDEHTESDLQSSICGYSPLGYGKYPHARKFSCFHAHCNGRTHDEFLEQVQVLGGPLCPAKEFAPESMVSKVFDVLHDKVYDIRNWGEAEPQPMTVTALNRVTPKIRMPNGNYVDQLPLWLKQPSAVVVHGAVHDVSEEAPIVHRHGTLKVNRASIPGYEHCKVDMAHVQPLLDFLDYLFIRDEEREYFLKWLACKAQNVSYRGPAIVLISQAQGTGKNTLMKLLASLFGRDHVGQVSMDTLISETNQFNAWATKLFVNVNESLAVTDIAKARRAYNKLKELVDPAPMEIEVNPKYQPPFTAICATSFLFFSNHWDAVYLQEGDRRFFPCAGPHVPADEKYFGQMYAWMATKEWRPHVWNYLLSLDVDLNAMMKAPPRTSSFDQVAHESKSPMSAVIDAAIDVWPTQLVAPKVIMELLVSYVPRGVPENFHQPARRIINDRLYSTNSHHMQCRTKKLRYSLKTPALFKDDAALMDDFERAKLFTDTIDMNTFKADVDAWLEAHGFDF